MPQTTTKGPKSKLIGLVADRRELRELFNDETDLRRLLPAVFRSLSRKSGFTADDVRKFMFDAMDALIEQATRDYLAAARADVEAAIEADEAIIRLVQGEAA
jgi:hypothetical protein